ncbi:hypothetical protein NW768_005188 [Fusarium equiseti]|uniref:Uncharacterized protein n=1 Tax=Fusarium equiseti TaxID=61235 RepID=A0ABQ8REJ6_FUSEQ|nr:hypothetical protein NW768_005188 [Fusarium equiseti]
MGQCDYKTYGAWFKEELENQSISTLQYCSHLKITTPGLPSQHNAYLKEKKITPNKMVAIHAYQALAVVAIALPFVIEAAPTPAIPNPNIWNMEVKPEATRSPVSGIILEPSIPQTGEGLERIKKAMKEIADEQNRRAQISNRHDFSSLFPSVFTTYRSIPDDDDDSEEHEQQPKKRDIADSTINKNKTTAVNEPRYHRLEQIPDRPVLLHKIKTHKVVHQKKADEKQQ